MSGLKQNKTNKQKKKQKSVNKKTYEWTRAQQN